MSFLPIAIVGRGCVLPGVLSPDALTAAVLEGRDLVTAADPDRWLFQRRRPAFAWPSGAPDLPWSDRGGYVRGFDEVFDPSACQLPAEALAGLDPLFLWAIHAAGQALAEARVDGPAPRAGVILGNLGFPTAGLARFTNSVWLERQVAFASRAPPRPDARNRFMSGLPAHLIAQAFGLGGPAFALDAACASSLYAMRIACDRLAAGEVDLMLAGAVACCDDTFIHLGFCALQALSRSGRTRPFHASADGLLPAEGAALVALKRLDDAVRDGDRIFGVIRGIGLSNDGRSRGFLAPDASGQVRAMRAAYAEAGWSPADVGLVECHATGTPVGDATELAAMHEAFAGVGEVPIGSVKSNMGHPITAAGAVALLKVLGALEARTLPPTLHVDVPTAALDGTPFRLLTEPEPWTGPRRAAISAFGFGGNNAHLLVEAWEGHPAPVTAPVRRPAPAEPIAVVRMAVRLGDLDTEAFVRAVVQGEPMPRRREHIALELAGLRFPPHDLNETLPQQLLVLDAAREAVVGLDLPRERTGVLVGMGTDPTVARYGLRWLVPELGVDDPVWQHEAMDAVIPHLTSAGVLGVMPNIPTNRLNAQFDLAGPSFSVFGEEASGVQAFGVARRALHSRQLDAAIVGAVDLCADPVHRAALDTIAPGVEPADAAVVLVLLRESDARARSLPILARLEEGPGGEPLGSALEQALGHPHAAVGWLRVAAAIAGMASRERTARGRTVAVTTSVLGAAACQIRVHEGDDPRPVPPASAADAPSRSLRWPAHLPDVVLPPPPEPTQRAAPQLPVPRPAVAGPAGPPRAATGPSRLETFRAHHARLVSLHKQHLAQLTHLHAGFLQTHQHEIAELAGVPAPTPPRPAAPRPAPPPPAPPAPILVKEAPPLPPPPPPEVPRTAPAPLAMRPTPPALRIAFNPFPFPEHVAVPDAAELPGPTLDRLDLELHGSGPISRIFGEGFAAQDAYTWNCRMPEPPLLLADRVLGIDAPALELGTGKMWTQTIISQECWFVRHDQTIPPCLMIEAGQADLMLISWMGIDPLNNHDERVYRLLGCDLTYTGPLPRVGDTMTFQIHIDGHANQGPVRLFFFHYDCVVDGAPRLSVRNGQAGFFTPKELEDSAGILWDPEGAEHDPRMRLDPPARLPQRRSFEREHLEAFARGDALACFGPGFERTASHVRTPRIQGPPMLIMDRIAHFDPRGGPWGRGYLKVELDIDPEAWFFQGHFKNDPCMPGTLMAEGCLQAMAFYLAAMGFTLERDGWRFEPVLDHTVPLRCRGQTIPGAKHMTYEVFVESIEDGPYPTIYGDVLGISDGLKSFWARRMGLRMVPDWPLETCVPELPTYVEPEPVATVEGFPFGYASLLACAWGRPSAAFGPGAAAFDDGRSIPRLPGAPYHFLSRVTHVKGAFKGMELGSVVEVAWDIPEDGWYFEANGCRVMPFEVLLEAALQPCGWLASYVGSALNSDQDLRFRNLDGDGEVLVEVVPTSGTLRTRVELVQISRSAGMIIEGFEVTCRLGDVDVYRLRTVFGFFPPAALANQVGVGQKPFDEARIREPSPFRVELSDRPAPYYGGPLQLPDAPLCMLDRLSGHWPHGGRAGLGRMRGEKDVVAGDWFFALHFFSDPVQPGSLGLAALIQLLQALVLTQGLAADLDQPRFEAIGTGLRHTWKYRGQVPPDRERITTEVEITEVRRDERGLIVIGAGSLWCDGLCIYSMPEIPLRVVEGAPPAGQRAPRRTDSRPLPPGTQVPSGAWETPGRLLETMPGRPLEEARSADFHASHVRRAQLHEVWGGTDGQRMHDAHHQLVGERHPLRTAVVVATGARQEEVRIEGETATCPALPLTRFALDGDALVETLDLERVGAFWSDHFGVTDWPVRDLYTQLVGTFTRRIRLEDPDLLQSLNGRGALFLANHQVALESLSFLVLAGPLLGVPTTAIAKDEHRLTWMGRLMELVETWPGVGASGFLAFFDRSDPAAFPGLLRPLLTDAAAGKRSVLVHTDGTRSRSCRERVGQVSAVLVDAAIAFGVPIVPVAFEGGLPVAPIEGPTLAFPYRHGQQDIVLGAALSPEALAGLPLKERKEAVLAALNRVGTPIEHRVPLPGRPALAAHAHRIPHPDPAWATLRAVLERAPSLHPALASALEAARSGDPDRASGPWAKALAASLAGRAPLRP